MLSVELQPAVRQIVERNEQLETENKELYDEVHKLLTEITALKATRHKFRQHCESMVANQASQLLSPSKEMQSKLQRQKRQIERLQSKLAATQSEAETAQRERAELEQHLERHADNLEKSAQIECDATKSCNDIARSINQLIGFINSEEEDESETFPETLPEAIEYVQKKFRFLGESTASLIQQRQQLLIENNSHKQTIGELETRIKVLETEKSATDDCNARYEKEREELGSAISTLRTALDEVKRQLISAEEEKKLLKEDNVRMKIELGQLKTERALAEVGSDDDE